HKPQRDQPNLLFGKAADELKLLVALCDGHRLIACHDCFDEAAAEICRSNRMGLVANVLRTVYGAAQQPETNGGEARFPVEGAQAYRASAVNEASDAFCRHIAQMRKCGLDDLHLAQTRG